MNTTYSTLKNVTGDTQFKVVTLRYNGQRKLAFLDQDDEIVGLINTDRPFFPLGTTQEVHKAAGKGLKPNAPYKGYPTIQVGQFDYILGTVESVDVIEDNAHLRAAKDLVKQSQDLYRRVTGREFDGGCIEGEYEVVNN
ncbi:hypothetical protein [Vibrio owensii]|uniref:hypothetical protein n=1 Tax=Vibrio harveyi group TaxID=717610 RepID=UPI003CC663D4